MLAGRKLLLADDSPTIQKVVELTFADEGVAVVSVGSGAEALARVGELMPDIVLADVCMPPASGYEVCEYIKQNADLRHIPVMLLVGSFEPFDEAEARRVGADDTLTKPFQSIRRLIDKVGGLISGKQDPDQVPTAELPHVDEAPAEPVLMSTGELEITTANTQPLPEGLADQLAAQNSQGSARISTDPSPRPAEVGATTWNEQEMETTSSVQTETPPDGADALLELGDLRQTTLSSADDFVLDIDLDDNAEAIVDSGPSPRSPAFVEPEVSAPGTVDWQIESNSSNASVDGDTNDLVPPLLTPAQMEDTQEWMREPVHVSSPVVAEDVDAARPVQLERVLDEPIERASTAASEPVSAAQLSPELIDAIARRAVEQLSERVVQQIAWEVVPQLAELLIKRKLEEKETQPK